GTEWVWAETRNLQSPFAHRGASRGTRREVERFRVHPNEIKSLVTGQAVLITKTPETRVTRVQVSPPAVATAGPGPSQPSPSAPSSPPPSAPSSPPPSASSSPPPSVASPPPPDAAPGRASPGPRSVAAARALPAVRNPRDAGR
ncbi:MAG TPA: hypothetical protein VGL51_18070, partial [Solirubrobacteraceae bacterium]